MVLAALLSSLVLCAIDLYYVHIGFGRHLEDVLASGTTLRQIDIMIWIVTFPYNTGITLVKLSALFFYARIFQISRNFKISFWITGALVVIWGIGFNMGSVFHCVPQRKIWDPSVKGYCLNRNASYIAAANLNVLVDLVILFLPFPMLRKLHTSLHRKIILGGAFFMGYCVIIVSIARLVTIMELEKSGENDATWDSTSIDASILLLLETPSAITSVCVPSMFYLFKRGFYHGVPSLFSSRDPSERIHGQYTERIDTFGIPVHGDIGRFERLEGGKNTPSREHFLSQTIATRNSDLTSQDNSLDDLQVRVRNDVDVQSD